MKNIRYYIDLITEAYSEPLHEDWDENPVDDLSPEVKQKLINAGYNLDLILYHGSNNKFTQFERRHRKTAEHLYSSPDSDTAGSYGKYLYACVGKTEPCADLIDGWDTIRKVAAEIADYYVREIEHLYPDEIESYKEKLKVEISAKNPEIDDYDLEDMIDDDPRLEQYHQQLAMQYAVDEIQSGKLYETDSGMQDRIMNVCFMF